MVLWYILRAHTCVVRDCMKSAKGSIQPWVLSPGSSCESEPAEDCYNRADVCHTSPCIFQVSSFCHPGDILNQLRVLVTLCGNLFTSLCSPWATINWLLSKTSFLMELQTSTCFVYAESDICEVNLLPTQLFCWKKEWTFNLWCHDYANFYHIALSFSKQKNPSLLHFSWNSRFSIFLIIHDVLLLIFSASVTFDSISCFQGTVLALLDNWMFYGFA